MATVRWQRQHNNPVLLRKVESVKRQMRFMVVKNQQDGVTGEHFVDLTKCFMYKKKLSAVIQPLGCTAPSVPGGAPITIGLLKFTLGNTIKGGIELPAAFIVHSTVTSVPLSADVTLPTCFFFLLATTF